MNHSIVRKILGMYLAASLGPRVLGQPQTSSPETNGPIANGSIKIEGWNLQSSPSVTETGETLSNPAYRITHWHPAVAPGTVLGTLEKDKTVPDPYYGVNLRNLIGNKFRSDKILSELPMDLESQFAVPWWYRTEWPLNENIFGRIRCFPPSHNSLQPSPE